jgi:hypothetical protein
MIIASRINIELDMPEVRIIKEALNLYIKEKYEKKPAKAGEARSFTDEQQIAMGVLERL